MRLPSWKTLGRRLGIVLFLFVTPLLVHAQSITPNPGDNQGAPTPLAPADPVSVRLEIFLVSLVTGPDGNRTERFTAATEARPGQTVEYRLFVRNVSDQTLPPGIVVITGPVPTGTEYVRDTATPSSDDLLTEYSIDRGTTFSVPPVWQEAPDGTRTAADPTAYDTVRWTLLIELEPGQEVPLAYRVIVR
jgi:uncharacterized repeat protein (TIGR01451 family)